MLHELCQTGVVHELERIHRFRAPREAAASLQLRHGAPRALDAYIEHDRVHPGTFDDHLATITSKWFDVTAAGGTVAVVCSTTDHVDAVNAAIQRARVALGELDATTMVPIGVEERATVGDVVATRRNDGSLTVSATRGHGTAVPSPEYVREHVRLGYAATEHGYQGETVTVGLEANRLVHDRVERRAPVGDGLGRQRREQLGLPRRHLLGPERTQLDLAQVVAAPLGAVSYLPSDDARTQPAATLRSHHRANTLTSSSA